MPRVRCGRGVGVLLAAASLLPWTMSGRVPGDDTPDGPQATGARPGLVGVYRSLVDGSRLARVDAKPALTVTEGALHPRLPAGPVEIIWSGQLELRDGGEIALDAFVCGELTVELDGQVVLHGRGEALDARIRAEHTLAREPGVYPLKIRYRSLPDKPLRVQIWWQGEAFSREPLPPWLLKHTAANRTPELDAEELRERGRMVAARLACAGCHRQTFPGIDEPPPGPTLKPAEGRLSREWLLRWLADPAKLRDQARMPALFTSDRAGFVERWMVAAYLSGKPVSRSPDSAGDHREGRKQFVGLGCATCHVLPDAQPPEIPTLERTGFEGLADRMPADYLAKFLQDPRVRYGDHRMPKLPVEKHAANVATYLLFWSPRTKVDHAESPPTEAELHAAMKKLKAGDLTSAARMIIEQKRCAACHQGLTDAPPREVAIANGARAEGGCLSERSGPKFALDAVTKRELVAYLVVAGKEIHPAPAFQRQRALARANCVRCHQRDTDLPPVIEVVGSSLGGAWLQSVPFQRTPRLTYPHQKYQAAHLAAVVREGVSGLRVGRYTYRMPSFGDAASELVQALAEADGELPDAAQTTAAPTAASADPTLGPLWGPTLVGFQGYACVSCHVWNGTLLGNPDPGAVGTELTRVHGRIRREWLERFLENPQRVHPRTPMPVVFAKGKPALLRNVLDGDASRQREALWSYLALGKQAPSPKPAPPVPVAGPAAGALPLVAQIPLRLPNQETVEGLCLLSPSHDLAVWDVQSLALRAVFTGARLLRGEQGRVRIFMADGTAAGGERLSLPAWQLHADGQALPPHRIKMVGYDRVPGGVRIRAALDFPVKSVQLADTWRFERQGNDAALVRELRAIGIPRQSALETRLRAGADEKVQVAGVEATEMRGGMGAGDVKWSISDGVVSVLLLPNAEGDAAVVWRIPLPPAQVPPRFERLLPLVVAATEPAAPPGPSDIRPGYRLITYPRPKTIAGEDLVMPSAVAADPKTGTVYVASMKHGQLFKLEDPTDDGREARFVDFAGGLFQEPYAMLGQEDGLYVLHRRNLTRVRDSDGDGKADQFDRVAALPQAIADEYDYAYGLVRDRQGNFILSYAPHSRKPPPGAGGAVRLDPRTGVETLFADGLRNPLGWCTLTDGQIAFSDNQGEWVATNKLCVVREGRYYGYPAVAREQHAHRPAGKTAVWVPYAWAKSINGITCDNTRGKFGPFAGQVFLAELMFGGAIVRAQLELVNGEYQGACFPFVGPVLLGPLTLAFDPRGRLYVGSITEPAWMAQPDRGALYRLDYTGEVPFEMQSIHVEPSGFRIVFTRPVSRPTASDAASYVVEHFRYEYSGAYGSPELDRTRESLKSVEVLPDGRGVRLKLPGLVKDRVYMIAARGVRSAQGETLVQSTGAYTLNEIPAER